MQGRTWNSAKTCLKVSLPLIEAASGHTPRTIIWVKRHLKLMAERNKGV